MFVRALLLLHRASGLEPTVVVPQLRAIADVLVTQDAIRSAVPGIFENIRHTYDQVWMTCHAGMSVLRNPSKEAV